MQKTTIQDFKDGKFTILVATNVIEEGLDLPTCDLIISFD